jgi:hypothetical protein
MSANVDRPRDDEVEEDAVSIRAFLNTLWSYRHAIGLAVLAVGAVVLIGSLVAFLWAPVERVGTVRFRLLFDGAALGRYPNGTPFSSSEIVGAPVMMTVYQANDLERFGSYEAFKASVFILAANPDVDMLTDEYQAKLADSRLTSVDRTRIEEEFRSRRAALVDPVFSLNLRRRERLTMLPAELVEKILNDALKTWAKRADAHKGAAGHNIPVLSKDILDRRVIESEDYLVAVDILRSKTNRVIKTIDTLAALPGAHALRTGKDRISLAEVRSNLEDVVRFKLEPLLDLVRSQGVTKNVRELRLYAQNQLFQLRLERERSQRLITTLQESINAYTTQRLVGARDSMNSSGGSSSGPSIVPQLDQSFIDRLMAFSTAAEDQEYRRDLTNRVLLESERAATIQREAAYYEDLVATLSGTVVREAGTAETVALITTRTAEAFDQVSSGIDQIFALYAELSAQNLNPSTTLYAVTEPFTLTTTRTLLARTLGLYFVLVLAITLIVAAAGSLVHHAMKEQ